MPDRPRILCGEIAFHSPFCGMAILARLSLANHSAAVRHVRSNVRIVEALAKKRDERKDGFAKVIAKAMNETVGDADEATKFLAKHGITRSLVKRAVDKIGTEGKPFTLWTLVDTLTRLTQEVPILSKLSSSRASTPVMLAIR